ncbi:exported hypothetical protein [Bradyrhizobium sp. STM 3843]|uniref:hypothetical protein n=1 Tax=Bradyrhizobium sp. STM 3843 TaxID=551947 RepID=UPI00024037C5|nr:hypothetical protein [Bradyrhizobium sp. STM 3843]CCE08437.1 exported hypothetical protein [Bradyrhizobium sp. STM 3843]
MIDPRLLVVAVFCMMCSAADGAAPPAFRAYLTAAQVFTPPTPLNYTQVLFNAVAWDTTGWFDTVNHVWKPQASGTALCTWQVWDQAGVYNSQSYGITAKLIGTDYLGNNKSYGGVSEDIAAIGTLGSYPNTAQSQLTALVHVDAGDTWKVSNYVQSASPPTGTVTIDPNPAHTMWSCMFFAD